MHLQLLRTQEVEIIIVHCILFRIKVTVDQKYGLFDKCLFNMKSGLLVSKVEVWQWSWVSDNYW